MANSWIKYFRGVASFTQIRTCTRTSSRIFFKNLLRAASSIPLWVHGLISATKVSEGTILPSFMFLFVL